MPKFRWIPFSGFASATDIPQDSLSVPDTMDSYGVNVANINVRLVWKDLLVWHPSSRSWVFEDPPSTHATLHRAVGVGSTLCTTTQTDRYICHSEMGLAHRSTTAPAGFEDPDKANFELNPFLFIHENVIFSGRGIADPQFDVEYNDKLLDLSNVRFVGRVMIFDDGLPSSRTTFNVYFGINGRLLISY